MAFKKNQGRREVGKVGEGAPIGALEGPSVAGITSSSSDLSSACWIGSTLEDGLG